MSDVPLGPDWWRASNGLYYPPTAKPGRPRARGEEAIGGEPGDAERPSPPDEPTDASEGPAADEPEVTTVSGWGDERLFDEPGRSEPAPTTTSSSVFLDDPLDDPYDDEEDDARRGWLLPVALVVLLLAILVGAGVWWSMNGDDDSDDAATSTTATTAATDTTDGGAPTSETTATTVDENEVSAFELGIGDCFDVTERAGDDGAVVETVTLVDCDEPHRAEVFAIETIEAADTDPFPGVEERDATAMGLCEPGFEEFVGIPAVESELALVWLAPTEESWDDGDREVTCAVSATGDERLEESVAGAAR